jgi:para-aminobenzoate synthetase/4-amino-4-deoxychorismate lyase
MIPQFIFDFPLDAGAHRLLSFGAPREILCATRLEEVRAVLRGAEQRACAGAWVCGFVSHDAATAFDTAYRTRGQADLPLAWFGVFDSPLPDTPLPAAPENSAGPWQPGIGRQRFETDIASLRQCIFDGAAYQINYTLRLHSTFSGDDLAWFARLRDAQPAGYCAYLNLGRQRILSASPELFFQRNGDVITTRPMKGTARRGRWPEEDRRMAEWLRQSEKNRAENLMIVDLLRNDLSRIALPSSIRVEEMFAIERHPTVWQMTSTISAQARPHTLLDELFAALFPCGSVTGAPKAKALEFIAQLESEPRGIYCGAIGLIQPGGNAMFNVAIRTVTLDSATGEATCGVGGGITWDSTAGDEYDEALIKARFLEGSTNDFRLLETLRLSAGEFFLLEHHLSRFAASAEYFGFVFAADDCRQRLHDLARQHRQGVWRVRLTLGPAGDIETTISAMPFAPRETPGFALAETHVKRESVWLYHKTTRRSCYEEALAAHPDVFDVLLWNEDGQLTEFTRGNLVLEIDGIRYTPPQGSGLLDGTLRRELLERGEVKERELHRNDLKNASRILFINSLRGEIEVHWQHPSD